MRVFDSHRRDLLGMGLPLGTCTLIEIDSLVNLVQHFRNVHAQTSDTYEIKGVNIMKMQSGSILGFHVTSSKLKSKELSILLRF